MCIVALHEMCNLCLSPSPSGNVYERAEKFVLQWCILNTSPVRALLYMGIDSLDISPQKNVWLIFSFNFPKLSLGIRILRIYYFSKEAQLVLNTSCSWIVRPRCFVLILPKLKCGISEGYSDTIRILIEYILKFSCDKHI